MKLGLFGGSFDPIHAGHVVLAQSARKEARLDRVVFLPTADPPHKPSRNAPAWARFAMVELALLDEEGLYASAHELTPGRTAYTIDTVEHFRETEPEARLHLLVGSDSLAQLHTWKRWQDLIRLTRLVVLRRAGWGRDEVESRLPTGLRERLAESPPLWVGRPVDLSSTELRQAVHRQQELPEAHLAPRVLDYIRKYRLYR